MRIKISNKENLFRFITLLILVTGYSFKISKLDQLHTIFVQIFPLYRSIISAVCSNAIG